VAVGIYAVILTESLLSPYVIGFGLPHTTSVESVQGLATPPVCWQALFTNPLRIGKESSKSHASLYTTIFQ